MNNIILGNILALCAMITDSISTTRKKNTEILGIQIISQFFYGSTSIVLKGYSATVQNVVAVFRLKERPRALKVSFGINSVLFCIFNIVIMNYVGTIANAVVAISSFVGAARGDDDKKNSEKGH